MNACAETLTFTDLSVGQQAAFDVTVTQHDIDRFADLSGDRSPLHVDAAFARRRGYEDRVAHGAFLVALASRLVGMSLPGQNALLLTSQMSFLSPVLPGARLRVTGTVDQMSDSVRSVVVKVGFTDIDRGTPIARGRLTIGFTEETARG